MEFLGGKIYRIALLRLSKLKVQKVWWVGIEERVEIWIEVHAFYFNIIDQKSFPAI